MPRLGGAIPSEQATDAEVTAAIAAHAALTAAVGHADGAGGPLWVPAGPVGATSEWIALAGAPNFAQFNAVYGAIAYDTTTPEAAQWLRSLLIPDDYVGSIAVSIVSTNLGAGAGGVVWRIGYSKASGGVTFAALTVADVTIAAPAQNVPHFSASVINPPVAARDVINFSVSRVPGDVGDTLANDAGFIGLLITYTANK